MTVQDLSVLLGVKMSLIRRLVEALGLGRKAGRHLVVLDRYHYEIIREQVRRQLEIERNGR